MDPRLEGPKAEKTQRRRDERDPEWLCEASLNSVAGSREVISLQEKQLLGLEQPQQGKGAVL